MSIKYHSSVGSSVQGRGPGHLRIPSTLDGAPMGGGRGQGRLLQNVYGIVSVLPDTTPVPSTNVRSGRRTDTVTTNRLVIEGALGGEVRPLWVQPRRGALVPLRAVALGLGTDHERYTVFRPRLMSAISTLRCRCPKLLPRGTTLQRTHVAGGIRAPVQKSM